MDLDRITPEEAGISSEAVEETILALMHKRTQMNGFMAARNGKVFAEGWWSPYSANLVHSNHSVGKSFTCTAVGIAESEGLLSFDEKMVDIFADEICERGITPPEGAEEITVRDVMTMTNGMARHPDVTEDWIGDYFRTPMKYRPGTHFMYNSSGSFLLGALVTKKTGKSIKEYLTEKLFLKIGINPDDFVWLRFPGDIDAEPGTFAKTEDILRLGILYCQGGEWAGEQVLPEKFVREALSVQVDTSYAPEQLDGRCGYGYQLWACSRPGVFRFDGGQGQFGIIWPEKQMVVAIHEGALMPYGPQETLEAVYDHLFSAVSNGPLSPDPEAYRKLSSLEQQLSMPDDGENETKLHDDLSGRYIVTEGIFDPWMGIAPPSKDDLFKMFRDPEKNRKIEEFSLKDKEKEYLLSFNGTTIEAFFDGKQRLQTIDNVFPGLNTVSATANFINSYTLEIRLHWINSWAETKIRFEDRKGYTEINIFKLRLNEEDNWLTYHVKAIKENNYGK